MEQKVKGNQIQLKEYKRRVNISLMFRKKYMSYMQLRLQ